MAPLLHAGAMIVYKQNMILDNPIGPPTLRRYIGDIQAHATIPLMVTMDEEGGGVDRLGLYGFAPPLPACSRQKKSQRSEPGIAEPSQ